MTNKTANEPLRLSLDEVQRLRTQALNQQLLTHDLPVALLKGLAIGAGVGGARNLYQWLKRRKLPATGSAVSVPVSETKGLPHNRTLLSTRDYFDKLGSVKQSGGENAVVPNFWASINPLNWPELAKGVGAGRYATDTNGLWYKSLVDVLGPMAGAGGGYLLARKLRARGVKAEQNDRIEKARQIYEKSLSTPWENEPEVKLARERVLEVMQQPPSLQKAAALDKALDSVFEALVKAGAPVGTPTEAEAYGHNFGAGIGSTIRTVLGLTLAPAAVGAMLYHKFKTEPDRKAKLDALLARRREAGIDAQPIYAYTDAMTGGGLRR